MIVFAGPSVSPEYRQAHTGIDWRPPAVAGDLLALVGSGADKILLIDGLFDERASVRHKEALLLMATVATLYGAASMGALRAAELAEYGMIPLGRIASAYRSGLLVGDDEVALVHGDQRIDWQAISIPMVEVRATLCAALRAHLIDYDQARTLRRCWHDIYFVDRDWPAMIDTQQVVSRELATCIAAMHVPLKRLDAEAAIEFAMKDSREPAKIPPPPDTLFFDRLRAQN